MKLMTLALCLMVAGAASAEDKMHGKMDHSKMAGKMAAAEKSLYERLGGEKAITAVVEDFVGRAAANPKVNFFRDGKFAKTTDVPKLKKHLVQFISMATGGPSKYEGKDMKAAHTGMKIKESEFNAIAGDLTATLDKFKVPAKEKNELMTIVGGTKGAIVEM